MPHWLLRLLDLTGQSLVQMTDLRSVLPKPRDGIRVVFICRLRLEIQDLARAAVRQGILP